ncbi:MAG: polysaccharide pyruvyl transferase family protein [Kiritimatiellia bacterium]
MNIGLFTLPFHSNYGGILQAWALQETLREMGHDPILLRQPGFHAAWALQPAVVLLRAFRRWRGEKIPLLARFHDARLERQIARFVQTRIRQSPILATPEERARFVRGAGLRAVLAGSDQIWRPGITSPAYFLDFLEGAPGVRRIAYAASFGADHVEFGADTARFAGLAKRFDAVSVREEASLSVCRELFGIHADCVADPTLLLPDERYREIASATEAGGITTYFLAGQTAFRDLAHSAAASLGMEEHALPSAGDFVNRLVPPAMPSVEQWLGTLVSAQCMLTDSFHGTVFAILFGKPFASLDNGTGAGRIRSLLRVLGLDNRLLPAGHPLGPALAALSTPLPGDLPDRIELVRAKSRKWLHDALASPPREGESSV